MIEGFLQTVEGRPFRAATGGQGFGLQPRSPLNAPNFSTDKIFAV